MAVSGPDGVTVSGNIIGGDYDIPDAYPLTLTPGEGMSILIAKIDDVETPIIENVISVPYTAQEIFITAKITTAGGVEYTEVFEYANHVEYKPVRIIVDGGNIVTDQSDHIASGVVDNTKFVLARIVYNGADISSADRSKASFRVYTNGAWIDYRAPNNRYPETNTGFYIPVTDDIKIQAKYVDDETYISNVYDVDVAYGEITISDDVVLTTSTEGLIIDNDTRTITGTLVTNLDVIINAHFSDSEVTDSRITFFYPPTRAYRQENQAIKSDLIAQSVLCVAGARIQPSNIISWAPDYTVNVTIAT